MKTIEEKEAAELQIIEERVPVNYDTREYPVEVLIDKYQKEEFVIPPYQRNFVWEKDIEKMSKFRVCYSSISKKFCLGKRHRKNV